MLYSELLDLINNNYQITIVSNNKNTNSEVARLYFLLYHNPLYSNKISISKMIIVNHNIRTAVHGKTLKKENMKQIHFVHIDRLEKWMLETSDRMDSIFRLKSNSEEVLKSEGPKSASPLKKYKLYSKIMYNQRVIILLDNIKIPDKLNPSLSIIGNEIDTLEHHEWKLYLTNLIKKYNELKSKYFIISLIKPKRGKRTIKTLDSNDKLSILANEFDFKPLTDEEKQIIHETDEAELRKTNFSEIPQTDAQIEAMIRIQSQITNYNANRIYSINDKSKKGKLKEMDSVGLNDLGCLSDLEILEQEILKVYSLEPDQQHPKYVTKFDVIDDILKLPIPKINEIIISMDETQLLNQYSNYSFNYGNAILFHISVNGLPQLVNYKAPNYLNKQSYKNINILKIDYIILNSKNLEIIKRKSFYVRNYNIHNTVQFEVNNKINDDYRNENGISFLEIAEFINNDILENKVKYIISHGTDVNYNLLLIEYERNMLNLDIFKNIIIVNTKQYLWKRDVKERMEDFEECKNCKTKIDMIYNLLKTRLRIGFNKHIIHGTFEDDKIIYCEENKNED